MTAREPLTAASVQPGQLWAHKRDAGRRITITGPGFQGWSRAAGTVLMFPVERNTSARAQAISYTTLVRTYRLVRP